jgi:hypothetical protein
MKSSFTQGAGDNGMMRVYRGDRHQPILKSVSASSYKESPLPCVECAELRTHEFRSSDDLLHALQLAALEVDRGVLSRVLVEDLSGPEQEALDSAFATRAIPGALRYRFKCAVCGDRFELIADTAQGTGGWTREAP